MSYLINIDEDQRNFILESIRAAKLPIDQNNDSIAFLEEMLDNMRQVEEDNPGCIHGLCL